MSIDDVLRVTGLWLDASSFTFDLQAQGVVVRVQRGIPVRVFLVVVTTMHHESFPVLTLRWSG